MIVDAGDPRQTIEVRSLTIAGPAGALDARLYRLRRPANSEGASRKGAVLADTLLVFFHGGGFVSGSVEASDGCMRELALRIDAAVLAPSYAQAPAQAFPAATEDAYAAIADCAAHPRRYGWSGRALIVGGIEAGGNLAAVAALMARDRGGPPLAGQMLLVPLLDPGLTSGSMRCAGNRDANVRIASRCADAYRDYLPRATDRMHPYASPLASTRLKGLPPTLMVSIEDDPLRDEADAYVAKLTAAAVSVRTLVLRLPSDTPVTSDIETRCRVAFDRDAYAAMAAFVAGASASASPTPS